MSGYESFACPVIENQNSIAAGGFAARAHEETLFEPYRSQNANEQEQQHNLSTTDFLDCLSIENADADEQDSTSLPNDSGKEGSLARVLKELTNSELLKLAEADSMLALQELTKRYDEREVEFDKPSLEAAKLLQEALSKDKEIVPSRQSATGKPYLSDQDLSEERRFFFHRAIVSDIETVYNRAAYRLRLANLHALSGNYAEALQVQMDGSKIMNSLPLDMMKEEQKLLARDKEKVTLPSHKKAMQETEHLLDKAIKFTEAWQKLEKK
ncbi:MAG: hypothetical protein K2Z81_03280 [Cyanobacteria bacterium]|nr:hypothetical protein [Cyanobacteriota bacterium]